MFNRNILWVCALLPLLLLATSIFAKPKSKRPLLVGMDAGGERLCPTEANDGKWVVNKSIPSFEELRKKFPMVRGWGVWEGPTNCRPIQRIAIIIPHRDRLEHLRGLLNNLHPFLQRQRLQYQIFVANQAFPASGPPDKFNRGKLINAAFAEIQRQFCTVKKDGGNDCFDCYIFHDVDLVPEDDRNLYKCTAEPTRLMSGSEEGQDNEFMGGITAMRGDQFRRVNGYSNDFWGWGSEDVNLRLRFDLLNQSLNFVKGPIGQYTTLELIKRPDDRTNPSIRVDCRDGLNAKVGTTWPIDGLSNLHYKLLGTTDEVLYTNITVDLLMSLKGHPCGGEKMFDWKLWHRR